MKRMYVIQWKSLVNGRAGRGTKLFEREQAEQLVQELNHEYPQIQHELIEVGQDEPSSSSTEPQVDSSPEPLQLAGVR